MIHLTLWAVLLAFQGEPAPPSNLPIWTEIAKLEGVIQKTVAENDTQFRISRSDPVYGYYIQKIGVLVVIPVRYLGTVEGVRRDNANPTIPNTNPSFSVAKKELQRRSAEWKERVQRNELLKEANFQKVITNLKTTVPTMLALLSNLTEGESMTLIVEERPPAWFHAGFSLKKNPTRKVVTLTIDKDLISNIQSSETVLDADWLKRIQTTTTTRSMVSLLP